MSTSLSTRAQWRVLTDRYRDVVLGDWPTLLLLVGQAPAIGALCAAVWGTVDEGTPSLWFVLALSSQNFSSRCFLRFHFCQIVPAVFLFHSMFLRACTHFADLRLTPRSFKLVLKKKHKIN